MGIAEFPSDVTAVIVSYHSEERIADSIKATEDALAHLDSEVIVVDNASTDASVAIARDTLTRGQVIANSSNLGYGHAANQGIIAAQGRTTLILNDDARLAPGAIDAMLRVLESDPEVSLVGPRMVDENGEPMPSARMHYPGLSEEFGRLGDIFSRVNRNKWYPADTSAKPTRVAWLVGACILGDTAILRSIGGFNPAFFLYSEDIDLSRRLHGLGYSVCTVPNATCVHMGEVSTSTAYNDMARVQRRADARSLYYRIWLPRAARSLVHFRRALGLKHQPWRLRYHLPKVIYDGPSLSHLRYLKPLT